MELMTRVDEKFIFHQQKLESVLDQISSVYKIVSFDNNFIQDYKTKYLDSADRIFYNQHHNGRYSRYKIRFREYVNSNLSYLEIKKKNNKKLTTKKRIKVSSSSINFSSKHLDFIKTNSGISESLQFHQTINFKRMTFVHKFNHERLTIDFNVSFKDKKNIGNFEGLVIAELKKNKYQVSSDFKRILKSMNIRPTRVSKYCLTSLMLNKKLKHNRFKEKLLLIKKLLKYDISNSN